jgi:putative transposase
MPDHVHMLISIPPKYSVAEVIGYLKGKSSIWIAQNVERKLRNFLGHKFWASGYFVWTVGRDAETIRAYIRNQGMASIFDISHRTHATRDRERLASIIDFSDDAIISKDLDGVIVTWNKGAERIWILSGPSRLPC